MENSQYEEDNGERTFGVKHKHLEVERIVTQEQRTCGPLQRTLMLIKWNDLDYEHLSWEPKSFIVDRFAEAFQRFQKVQSLQEQAQMSIFTRQHLTQGRRLLKRDSFAAFKEQPHFIKGG